MRIGYARVSTDDQKTELQIDALKAGGCERIYVDTISGAKAERPELDKAKAQLRTGDTLLVWRLDRLGRSLKDLISWMQQLDAQGVSFASLNESIDTSTPTGKLVFHVFGAIAEFERDLIRELTKAGLTAARARGRVGGRKPKLNPTQRKALATLYAGKEHTAEELCSMFNISRRLLYHVVKQETEAEK